MPTSVFSALFSEGSPGRLKTTLWGCVLASLVLVAYFRMSWPTFGSFIQAMDFCDTAFCDFVTFYYEMGKEIFLSKSPVFGYFYSPFSAIFFGFFGMLPLSASTVAWSVLLVATTAGLFILSYRIVFPQSSFIVIPAFLALFFTSYPVLHNFKWGQVSVLLTFFLLAALVAYQKQYRILSAFLLAAATSLKFYPGFFIFPFVFRKEWKLVWAFLGWCVILFVLIPLVVLGPDATWSFLGRIAEMAYAKQRAARAGNSQFFPNVMARWISAVGLQGELSSIMLRTAAIMVVEANLVLSFLLVWLKAARAMEWSFVLCFLSLPFLVATSWPHYLVFLPFCQLFLFGVFLEGRYHMKWLLHSTIAGAIGLSAIASSVMMLQVVGGWNMYNTAGFLFFADMILLVPCYAVVIPFVRDVWRNPPLR